jgi:hypothetical protein
VKLTAFQYLLWTFSLATYVTLAAVMVWRHSYRRWPFLFAMALFETVFNLAIVFLSSPSQYAAYFYTYWTAQIVRALFGFGLIRHSEGDSWCQSCAKTSCSRVCVSSQRDHSQQWMDGFEWWGAYVSPDNDGAIAQPMYCGNLGNVCAIPILRSGVLRVRMVYNVRSAVSVLLLEVFDIAHRLTKLLLCDFLHLATVGFLSCR